MTPSVPLMQRKAAWSSAPDHGGPASTSAVKRLDHTLKDAAQRNYNAKKHLVQIAQEHLSCCVKEREAYQQQLAPDDVELAAYGERGSEVRLAQHA